MKDKIVFTFGRFNPPTTGHEKLIEKVAAVAKKENADFMVFPSHSQNPKKDPLDIKTKIGFMKKMFPNYAKNIIQNNKAKTAINVATLLYEMGYKECAMVVGGDRVTEFKTLLNKYNGVEGKHGLYDFKGGIEIHSAGERDPDAEGVTGMSASKMRAAAAANDYESFKKGLPPKFEKTTGKKIFDALKDAMGISEELSIFLSPSYEEFITDPMVELLEDIDDADLFEFLMERKTDLNNKMYAEYVSQKQIDDLEKFADKMLAKHNINFTFTKHFVDRMNDKRNDPEIKVAELQKFFKKIQQRKGSQIKANPDIEAVLKDMSTNLNLPVVINYKDGEFEVVHKTIMRKKNFSTSSKELKYEDFKMNPDREKELEKIAQDLPDADFKKRYGDEWKSVKMATAMNILKKKLGYSTEEIDEFWLQKRSNPKKVTVVKKKTEPMDLSLKQKMAIRKKVAMKIGDKEAAKLSWSQLSQMQTESISGAENQPFVSKAGAGEWGSKKLRDTYMKDTPHMKVSEKLLTPKERYWNSAIKDLDKIVKSKGDQSSIKSYAVTIAKSYGGMDWKELLKKYKES